VDRDEQDGAVGGEAAELLEPGKLSGSRKRVKIELPRMRSNESAGSEVGGCKGIV